jgi:hypothetical protein
MTEQAPQPPGRDDLDPESWQRLYGRWAGLTPVEVAALSTAPRFRGGSGAAGPPQAAGGPVRPHEDTDVAILARDLEDVHAWLAALHLWERDESLRLPLDEIGHTLDDVSYYRPCILFLYKARQRRPKDEADFEADFAAALPQLAADDRDWLYEALERAYPGHPWPGCLRSGA